MGNQANRESVFTDGDIFIELQSATCVGGEYTSGVVHMDIRKIFYTEALYLNFYGFEKVSNEEIKEADLNSKAKNLVICYKQLLKPFHSGFAPHGQYSFPFQFKTPYWLPPSFCYSEKQQLSIRLYYFLEAIMYESKDRSTSSSDHTQQPNSSRNSGSALRCLKTKVKVKLIQNPLSINLPFKMKYEQKLKGVLFSNKGKAKLEVSMDRTCYTPGMSIWLKIIFDNSHAEKDIKSIRLQLMKNICALDYKSCSEIRRYIVLHKQKYYGIKRGQVEQINYEIPIKQKALKKNRSDSSAHESNLQMLVDDPDEFEYLIQPSIDSKLIKCDYQVDIRIEYQSNFISSSNIQKVSIPINIYFEKDKCRTSIISSPMQWRPYVFEVVKYEIDQQNNDMTFEQIMKQRKVVVRDLDVSEQRRRKKRVGSADRQSKTRSSNGGGSLLSKRNSKNSLIGSFGGGKYHHERSYSNASSERNLGFIKLD